MIKVTFQIENDLISGFVLTGHADFHEYGKDIVCSAVSALAINTVNSLEKIANVKPQVAANEKDGGYLKVTLPDVNQTKNSNAQVLLKSLKLGLTNIEQQYGKFIEINK